MKWKTYPNDNRYEVSDAGFVRRKNKPIRKPSVMPTGYCVIVFSIPKSKHVGRYIHRMVMETFVGECPKGMEVSHLNGNNSDNRLCNLIYESKKNNHARKIEHKTDFNGHRNPAAKLNWDQVNEIRKSTETESKLCVKYGVSRATIGRAKRNESWKFK